jgi:hypothetical protein
MNDDRLVQLLRMDTSICHNAHLGESMGQQRALYQIGGISPGQMSDFTTTRPLAKARARHHHLHGAGIRKPSH